MIEDIESATPALCRLHLASELRQLRLEAGVKAGDVVRTLVWSPSKLNRLESAENGMVEPADVIALCKIYQADDETLAILKGYAEVTKTKKDWWNSSKYRPAVRPQFRAFLGLEATAATLHTYQSEFVPGLLQTEAYVRVIHQRAHEGLSPEEIDRLVAVRMARQEVLTRKRAPLRLTAVINEAVLRRRVGNETVMREQLAHIAKVASWTNVRVQVVPFEAGEHDGMNGSFSVLQFPDRVLKPIVYLENLADTWVIRRETDVHRYEEVFNELEALAPGAQESLSMIKKASKEF
ncbi:helix-turn-helix domain-containing protein [Streptomyces sp. 110]|uniref:Helix-turn-helix domain-containing protein n=1 Tax=Streptomyces endocoffeicus TaxID=2898945 RepID=A0ABS1PS81_9ACTN|nr:helix-turn-helix transcriptional regulator [Streptomyces endocoffeicus]MBL1115296.1 helix-turn-helix domain-containing protein [Streptomyces endocoffeicus]